MRSVLYRMLTVFLVCAVSFVNITVVLAEPETVSAVSMDKVSAAFLAEANTLQSIMEKNAQELYSVAGLSKLPALLVVCEGIDQGAIQPTDMVSVSSAAAKVKGPTAFIEQGEQIAASELLKAAVMIGAGDAIFALGEHMCGTETVFLEKIQRRLQELGVSASMADAMGNGLQISTADLVKIGAALSKSECFSKHCMLTLDGITHEDERYTELVNPNRLIKNYAGCTGIATGSSSADGYCGIFSANRGETQLICVVLGAKNSSDRFETATQMLDYAFASIQTQKVAVAGSVIKENVRVQGGKRREINLVAKEDVVLLLDKNQQRLKGVEQIPEVIAAPFTTSDVLGYVVYQDESGAEVARVELVAQHNVEQASFRDYMREIVLGFLRV